MTKFTKEQLIEQAKTRMEANRYLLTRLPPELATAKEVAMNLAVDEIALAALTGGMEQEPVAWVSDKDKCDHDVFERGITACVLAISKHEAETICRGFSAATGCKVDWHFVGGRVHIKALRAAPQLPQPAVVPPEATAHDARMAVGFNRYMQAGYIDGWNACRAAMLKGGRDVE
ncbi:MULTISPECIES: hypothetical protein [unclassified Leclercia]|uniref:Eaa protein n=1 Tax=Leclercia barmai TaxID=2785629 RepID=A0ABS7RS89_9ENTR|nr:MULTISPECIES: hypothetical protein [unclassified Leclercia]MBZ0057137.1 hypothetical protein [Leclercia sp. EMC7]MCM5695312.1 hypothetical protein [Leclercia sp. LTM01]MCM5699719.1 hypothetical protein [Leclercia sp. LTM14]